MQKNPVVGHYDLIAKYWDRMYSQESFYQKGFCFIDSLRRKYCLEKEILDAACGTGYLLTFFEKAGYKTYGSDLSSGMLQIARNSLAHTKLRKAEFQKVSFERKFPLIVGFFNSFAYCQSTAELRRTLENLAEQLSDNGLLIFDLFVTKKPREAFGIKSYSFDNTHISRTVYGYSCDKKWFSEMVYIIVENKTSRIVIEKTTRGIFSERDTIACIRKAGLEPIHTGPGYLEGIARTFVAQKKQ